MTADLTVCGRTITLMRNIDGGDDMTQDTAKRENHALRTITAFIMFFIAFTHYYSQYEFCDLKVLGLHLMSAGRFVIPLFVMISGYYLYSKDGHAEASIGKKMVHILFLIVIYKLFYLILSSIYCIAGVVPVDYVIEEFLILSPPFTFDCYGGTVNIMTTQPIWFIYSLFLIYGLFYVLRHFKVDFKWSWVLALPILIVGVLMVDLLPMFGITEIGGVEIDRDIGGTMYPFIILPFFVMGYYIHKYKDEIDTRLSDRTIWIMLVFGMALMFLEMYIRPDHYQSSIYIGSFIFIMAAFIGSFRVPEDRARCPVLEYIGKYLTMWMYVFFAGANFIVRYALQPYADNELICEVLGPFIALALDVLFAFAFHMFLQYLGKRKAQPKAVPEAEA